MSSLLRGGAKPSGPSPRSASADSLSAVLSSRQPPVHSKPADNNTIKFKVTQLASDHTTQTHILSLHTRNSTITLSAPLPSTAPPPPPPQPRHPDDSPLSQPTTLPAPPPTSTPPTPATYPVSDVADIEKCHCDRTNARAILVFFDDTPYVPIELTFLDRATRDIFCELVASTDRGISIKNGCGGFVVSHWVEDGAVKRCAKCNRDFGVSLRRHHCRLCGRVFCWACSDNRASLPDLGYSTPVRVCEKCFNTVRDHRVQGMVGAAGSGGGSGGLLSGGGSGSGGANVAAGAPAHNFNGQHAQHNVEKRQQQLRKLSGADSAAGSNAGGTKTKPERREDDEGGERADHPNASDDESASSTSATPATASASVSSNPAMPTVPPLHFSASAASPRGVTPRDGAFRSGKRDKYGFIVGGEGTRGQDDRPYHLIHQHKQRKRWNQYLAMNPQLDKTAELRKLVRKGIPHELRGPVWQVLSGSNDRQAAHPSGYYHRLVKESEEKSGCAAEIEKDLRRTFPDNHLYESEEGLAMLRRVLLAYSVHNSTIGYCFPEVDTRVLTNCGLLFLDQIEWLQNHEHMEVLFACYDKRTKKLVYRAGKLQIPDRPPPHLVEFTSPGEKPRWSDKSGPYGRKKKADDADEEAEEEESQHSRHVSLRVTPEHNMFVQEGDRSLTTTRWMKRHGVIKEYAFERASTLLPKCGHASVQPGCRHCRAGVRMLACAEAGFVPQSTARRDALQVALGLNHTQFLAFIELLGFWLGDCTMSYKQKGSGSADGVEFSQVQQSDLAWLREKFAEAGLQEGRDWSSRRTGVQEALLIEKSAWFNVFDEEFGAKYLRSMQRKPSTLPSDTRPLQSASISASRHQEASPASITRSLPSTSTDTSSSGLRRSSISRSASVNSGMRPCDGDAQFGHCGLLIPEHQRLCNLCSELERDGDDDEDDEVEEGGEDDEGEVPQPQPQPVSRPPGYGIHWGSTVEIERTKSVKHIPDWALAELSCDEMRSLIAGLYRAHGFLEQRAKAIYTSSVRFRDQLMQALLHCGYSPLPQLRHGKGNINGYALRDQSVRAKPIRPSSYATLSSEEQRKYKPIIATTDSWVVHWAEVSRTSNTPGRASCWPSMPRTGCISREPYSLERDGRTWCVTVDHPDHLIIAQRAHRDAHGRVTKQSRPIIVGNCQSMNFITALCLLFMDEEPAFWLLTYIVEELTCIDSSPAASTSSSTASSSTASASSSVASSSATSSAASSSSSRMYYYQADLAGVHIDQAVFADLLADKLPRIAAHFDKMDLSIGPFTVNWFLCLFVNTLPLETALHVWDCTFSEGPKTLFRCALALMKVNEKSILQARDFEAVLLKAKHFHLAAVESVEFAHVMFDDVWLGAFPMSRIEQLRRTHRAKIVEELEERRRQLELNDESDRPAVRPSQMGRMKDKEESGGGQQQEKKEAEAAKAEKRKGSTEGSGPDEVEEKRAAHTSSMLSSSLRAQLHLSEAALADPFSQLSPTAQSPTNADESDPQYEHRFSSLQQYIGPEHSADVVEGYIVLKGEERRKEQGGQAAGEKRQPALNVDDDEGADEDDDDEDDDEEDSEDYVTVEKPRASSSATPPQLPSPSGSTSTLPWRKPSLPSRSKSASLSSLPPSASASGPHGRSTADERQRRTRSGQSSPNGESSSLFAGWKSMFGRGSAGKPVAPIQTTASSQPQGSGSDDGDVDEDDLPSPGPGQQYVRPTPAPAAASTTRTLPDGSDEDSAVSSVSTSLSTSSQAARGGAIFRRSTDSPVSTQQRGVNRGQYNTGPMYPRTKPTGEN